MRENVTYNELNECSEDLRSRIANTRERLNNIYLSDASYDEKMKVSEELDLLILEAIEDMEAVKNL